LDYDRAEYPNPNFMWKEMDLKDQEKRLAEALAGGDAAEIKQAVEDKELAYKRALWDHGMHDKYIAEVVAKQN